MTALVLWVGLGFALTSGQYVLVLLVVPAIWATRRAIRRAREAPTLDS